MSTASQIVRAPVAVGARADDRVTRIAMVVVAMAMAESEATAMAAAKIARHAAVAS